jgi:hypothetical protein
MHPSKLRIRKRSQLIAIGTFSGTALATFRAARR